MSELNLENLKTMLKSSDESSVNLGLSILNKHYKKINKKEVIKLYKLVPPIKSVKSYKDVCKQLGIEVRTIDYYINIGLSKKESDLLLTIHMLDNICKRFNNCKINGDYKDNKYFPCFFGAASGWRFCGSHCWVDAGSYGVVGFFFKDKKDSDYCGELFKNLFIKLIKR